MKFFIIIFLLYLNTFAVAETLYYKNINTSDDDAGFMVVEFPEDCSEIIEISNDKSLEFKNDEAAENKISECNTFLKGNKVKNTFKSGSDKILDSGVKVKDGIHKGLKSGTESITKSVSRETNLFLDDTIKLKDGIVNNTSKIINSTVETGGKISSGVSSFFKGIFSSK